MPSPALHLPPRLRDLVRYASVSVVSTSVGLTTLALLVGVGHWDAGWANVVATALGTIPSFELNRRWVWRRHGRPSLRREVLPFVVLCAVELVASTAAVTATAHWTAQQGWSHGVRTGADLVANVAAYGTLWVIQYLILDKVLFAGNRSEGGKGPGPDDAGGSGPVGPGVAVPDVELGRAGFQRTLRPSSALVEERPSGWPVP